MSSLGVERLKVALLMTVLSVATLVFSADSGLADPIRITVTEWCPYMCTGKDQRGFATDIVDAAFDSQGHEVEFVTLPWLRALEQTRKGETDGSLAPAKAEASDFIFPSLPVGHQQMCFFTRSDQSWRFEGWAPCRRSGSASSPISRCQASWTTWPTTEAQTGSSRSPMTIS